MLNIPEDVRIIVARHGESAGQVNKQAYIDHGDSGLGLTDTGWSQAFTMGQYLGEHVYGETGWPFIFYSDHTRAEETLSGCLHTMKNYLEGEPEIRPHPLIIEKHFGAYPHMHREGDEQFAALRLLSSQVYLVDEFNVAALFGETTKMTYMAAILFVEHALAPAIEAGHRDILIVSHGTVMRCLIAYLADISAKDFKDIPRFGNCDLLQIGRNQGRWTFRNIYKGETCEFRDELVIGHIHPRTVADLPPVPSHITKSLEEGNEPA